MMDNELLTFLKDTNTITIGEFIGKSGNAYNIETDLRKSMLSYENALFLGKKLYEEIKNILGFFYPVIGVPETGSLLATFVNFAYYNNTNVDFFVNMLRSIPKTYQSSSNSIYTVLPLNNTQEYILIEDDVVTGNTMLSFLEQALKTGVRITAVISVFGRKSAKAIVDYCNQRRLPYYELINVDELTTED